MLLLELKNDAVTIGATIERCPIKLAPLGSIIFNQARIVIAFVLESVQHRQSAVRRDLEYRAAALLEADIQITSRLGSSV